MARFISERDWLTRQVKTGRYVASIMNWKDWTGVAVIFATLILAAWKLLEILHLLQ